MGLAVVFFRCCSEFVIWFLGVSGILRDFVFFLRNFGRAIEFFYEWLRSFM